MFGSNTKKDGLPASVAASFDTLIGHGCTINGDVSTQKSMKIDGVINGNLEAAGSVVVEEHGKIKGNIKCNELLVYGLIEGNIHTESLYLYATSRIVGDLNTSNLQVEAGAVYQGAVNMTQPSKTETKKDVEEKPLKTS